MLPSSSMSRRPRLPVGRRLRFVDGAGITVLGMFAALVAITAAILVAIFCAVTYGGRAYGRGVCHRWGIQTHIPVRFVILGFADSGKCLARTPGGRWVVNSQWVAYVNGSK